MRVGIPKETLQGERRVAVTPDTVRKLRDLGFTVAIETGAGQGAACTDEAYQAAGAEIVPDAAAVLGGCEIVLKVRPPSDTEIEGLREGTTLISFVHKLQDPARLDRLNARRVTVLAMEAVPRISRAQKMDALSSQANLVGYRAVIEAAHNFGSFFTQQITAAGKIPQAKVLVIGAGVAGLAALGAAKGLGAAIRAFDTRASVKEQIQSMGGEFLEVQYTEDGDGGGGYAKEMSPAFIEAEMALFAQQAAEVDIVITTALIPNQPAPKLWLEAHVKLMKPGSVVVDLAAEYGGNCECTVKDEIVVRHGVTIIGLTDHASRVATTASQLYSMNMVHFLTDLGGAANWNVNLDDEIIRGACLAHDGAILAPPPPSQPSPGAVKAAPAAAPIVNPPPAARKAKGHGGHKTLTESKTEARKSYVYESIGLLLIALWIYLKLSVTGTVSTHTTEFLQHLTVFILACFVGWQVVWNVTAALHTPLMSVTNAISGIILIGGMMHAHGDAMGPAALLGTLAILLATINAAGGFLVTHRMLKMFRK